MKISYSTHSTVLLSLFFGLNSVHVIAQDSHSIANDGSIQPSASTLSKLLCDPKFRIKLESDIQIAYQKNKSSFEPGLLILSNKPEIFQNSILLTPANQEIFNKVALKTDASSLVSIVSKSSKELELQVKQPKSRITVSLSSDEKISVSDIKGADGKSLACASITELERSESGAWLVQVKELDKKLDLILNSENHVADARKSIADIKEELAKVKAEKDAWAIDPRRWFGESGKQKRLKDAEKRLATAEAALQTALKNQSKSVQPAIEEVKAIVDGKAKHNTDQSRLLSQLQEISASKWKNEALYNQNTDHLNSTRQFAADLASLPKARINQLNTSQNIRHKLSQDSSTLDSNRNKFNQGEKQKRINENSDLALNIADISTSLRVVEANMASAKEKASQTEAALKRAEENRDNEIKATLAKVRKEQGYVSLPSEDEKVDMQLVIWGNETTLVNSIPPEHAKSKLSMLNYLKRNYIYEADRMKYLFDEKIRAITAQHKLDDEKFKPIAARVSQEITFEHRYRILDLKDKNDNAQRALAPYVARQTELSRQMEGAKNKIEANRSFVEKKYKEFKEEESRISSSFRSLNDSDKKANSDWLSFSGSVKSKSETSLENAVNLRNSLENQEARVSSEKMDFSDISVDSRKITMPAISSSLSDPESRSYSELGKVMSELAIEAQSTGSIMQQSLIKSQESEILSLQKAIVQGSSTDIQLIVESLSPETIKRIKESSSDELKSTLGLK